MISTESLSKIPIFENLAPGDLDTLTGLWHARELKAGEILFRVGQPGTAMYVVEHGIIEIKVPISAGPDKEMVVSVFHDGDFFGEIALIDGLPRTATAAALEATRVLEMRRADFISFLMQRPAVAIAMAAEIGKRLRATNELVQSLASRNVNEEMDEQLSMGDKLADRIATFGGSWTFIIIFSAFLAGWIALNSVQFLFRPFDEFPFIFLNLMLSTIAAIQAPVIMMSQNRAQKKDRLRAEQDYQVNLKSELMLQQLHAKFDELRAIDLHQLQAALESQLAATRQPGAPGAEATKPPSETITTAPVATRPNVLSPKPEAGGS